MSTAIPKAIPLAAALTLAMVIGAPAAHAAPEEIQVYMDEINLAGGLGLDVHVNDVVDGTPGPDYPGGEASLHRWRLTPEFSYGLGGGFEGGLYLPLATIAADGTLRAEGVKLRLKWLAPHRKQGFYWGVNYEVGKVAHRLDENPWNNEVKLIGGWRRGKWLVGVNGNIDFALSGPAKAPATLEIATKLGYKLSPELTLGVESYNGMGAFKDPGHFGQNEHATFLVADATIGGWDVNAGVGKGYGANGDSLTVKFIIGLPIGRH